MRVAVLAAAILPVALAQWNTDVCNGVGGCMSYAGPTNLHPWVCPDGSRLNRHHFANDFFPAGYPGATIHSRETFPASCATGLVPAANDRLVSVQSRNGQTMYGFVRDGCTHPNPPEEDKNNCYTVSINESEYFYCQLEDSTGQVCVANPNAGRCERWGASAGRDECIGWEPGMPDFPDPNL